MKPNRVESDIDAEYLAEMIKAELACAIGVAIKQSGMTRKEFRERMRSEYGWSRGFLKELVSLEAGDANTVSASDLAEISMVLGVRFHITMTRDMGTFVHPAIIDANRVES